MNWHKYFPDSSDYLKDTKNNIEKDMDKHTGVVKHFRLILYHTHYLWLPVFVGIDILFAWILGVKPKK